ncbi:MAG: ATP-binding protein [Lachnospiraceae bacterium]|nr:ATP-binding protein [Lachnospiraceae bacterium]
MSETEITIEELADMPEATYKLVDVRNEVSFQYGTIPGAVHIEGLLEQADAGTLPDDAEYILFCMHGTQSLGMADFMRERGYEARSLAGGYEAWLAKCYTAPDMHEKIERDLITNRQFHEKLFSKFCKAVKQYQLVGPGDRIAVCISGGKDSMLMAKMFQCLKMQKKFDFDLVFLVMDPGYNDINRLLIEKNAQMLGVPITIFETKIFDAVYKIDKSPCYLCARMRRGNLYAKARELNCNKIALGHHYDDVIETTLMSMLWGGQIQTMMPKLHSTNFEGMELIRPMYFIRENDIMDWRDKNGLHFIQCACHFTDTCSSCREDGTAASKRMETKMLIKKLHETNPSVEANIMSSVNHVALGSILSYKKDGVMHSFLEDY